VRADDKNGHKVDNLRSSMHSFTPKGTLIYDLTDNTMIHTTVSRTTRFPTLKELYSSYLGKYAPNPDLKSQKAINYEAGIKQNLWDLASFKVNSFIATQRI